MRDTDCGYDSTPMGEKANPWEAVCGAGAFDALLTHPQLKAVVCATPSNQLEAAVASRLVALRRHGDVPVERTRVSSSGYEADQFLVAKHPQALAALAEFR